MPITDNFILIGRNLLAGFLLALLGLTISCQEKPKSPETLETIIGRCQSFLDKDDLDAASGCFHDAMLANAPRAEEILKAGTEALFAKCVKIKARKDYKNAIICFEGATELMPNSAHVQFNLADSYYEYYNENNYQDAQMLARAEEAVKKGLQFKNDDVAARALYAEILRNRGKYDDAIMQYQKLIEIDPKVSLHWAGLGLTQQKNNQDKEAIKSFAQAAQLDEKNALVYFFWAASWKKLGETEKATEMFEKTLQLDPANAEAKEELEKLKAKPKKIGN